MRTIALSLPPPGNTHDAVQIEATRQTLAMVPAFAYSLKCHLRDQRAVDCSDVVNLLTPAVIGELRGASKPTLDGDSCPVNVNDHTPSALAAREQEAAESNGATPAPTFKRVVKKKKDHSALLGTHRVNRISVAKAEKSVNSCPHETSGRLNRPTYEYGLSGIGQLGSIGR